MSTELATFANVIQSMSATSIDRIRQFENVALTLPQVDVGTSHILHAGVYARTILISEGMILTGALIKLATVLIVQGHVTAHLGDSTVELEGYHVLAARAVRKQAFVAHKDTYLTMIFASKAQTVRQAEDEFTDEADMLISRREGAENEILITGE